MRVVFFGTPEFAVPSLHAIVGRGLDVVGVITQPDKPQGRSRSRLLPPPVKAAAEELRLAVLQPERPAGDLFTAQLKRLKPDIGVVVAYGHILRPEILGIPPLGMINVHASLLPRWRGAAPIQHAILAGDDTTGISIMQLDEGMDSGPVLLQRQVEITPGETAGQLAERLSELGAEALEEAVAAIENGEVRPVAQDESGVTLAPKITRQAARIDWLAPADRVARLTRAFDPNPGAWAELEGQALKLFQASPVGAETAPGEIATDDGELLVGCGSGSVAVAEVQPAGRKRMAGSDWLLGHPDLVGKTLT